MIVGQELIGNLAIVVLSVLGWEALSLRIEYNSARQNHILFGAIMGASAVVSMMLAVHLPGGMIFDLRSSLIAVAGFFSGPLAGLIAGAIAGTYRFGVGGAGMPAGLIVIGLATASGIFGHFLTRRRPDCLWQIVALSVAATSAMMIGMLSLPAPANAVAFTELGIPILGLTFIATLVSSLIILQGRQLSDERRLLYAAMHQSPDFQYVKNRQSQFVVVNQRVAKSYGFARPDDMRGKTDFDIAPADRAIRLYDAEQGLMRTRQSVQENIEYLSSSIVGERWYSTSKSAVIGRDGDVIGLTGATHDITEQKRNEAELVQSRNLLQNALSGMSDGLAMFDANDVLMFCNEQYREIFALTAHVRVPGVHLRTILEAVVKAREQVGIETGKEQEWIDYVIGTVHNTAEREVQLKNGHWIRVRTRRSGDGVATVTVSDITQAKLAQEALVTLTGQLKSLAGTDGLTGLANRRAFDESLASELSKTAKSGEPLSLLMIDVDHFKPFNDIYGHLAGDDCLKAIGKCLSRVVDAPRRVAARFGGEEFAVILPGADPDAASQIAEMVRDLLAELNIPHSGNPPGTITVSIGIATLGADATDRNHDEIVRRADTALYEAKRGGRDRVELWRGKQGTHSDAA